MNSEVKEPLLLSNDYFQIGFDYILQDYYNKQDFKKAIDGYFDAFILVLSHPSQMERKKYTQYILKGICKGLKMMKDPEYSLILLSKATELICSLQNSRTILAFSIKLINNATKILCKQKPNALELLSYVSKWTLSLQRSHHIPGKGSSINHVVKILGIHDPPPQL